MADDAWLYSFYMPESLTGINNRNCFEDNPERIYCLFFCPRRAVYLLQEEESVFLNAFLKPCLIMDVVNDVEISRKAELAKKWISSGVIVPCRTS